jgi:hypothetical protein
MPSGKDRWEERDGIVAAPDAGIAASRAEIDESTSC